MSACRHTNYDTVTLAVTGETVAMICTDCHMSLPLGYTGTVDHITNAAGDVVAYIPVSDS